MTRPQLLKPGDTVAILSPASAVDPALIDGAVKALQSRGFNTKVMAHATGAQRHIFRKCRRTSRRHAFGPVRSGSESYSMQPRRIRSGGHARPAYPQASMAHRIQRYFRPSCPVAIARDNVHTWLHGTASGGISGRRSGQPCIVSDTMPRHAARIQFHHPPTVKARLCARTDDRRKSGSTGGSDIHPLRYAETRPYPRH